MQPRSDIQARGQDLRRTACASTHFTMVLLASGFSVVQALAFLEVMQTSNMQMAPDTVTYNTVLKACCNADQLDKAMQVSY